MTRAAAALRTLAVTALLAATGLTTGPAPAMAATPLTPGRIAFDDFMTGQIYAVNPDGTGLAQLTHEPNGIAGRFPAWSPDGSRILFARVRMSDFIGRIWIMNADGTGQRRIASDMPGRSDMQPVYTPNGRHIVFTRCDPGFDHCSIWIMRSDGTHRHLLIPFLEPPNETSNRDPKVSPDGRRLAFTRAGFHGVASQVWVARIDGTHARPLTAPRLQAFAPDWSPDGSYLAFTSNINRAQSSLYAIRANGTSLTRLATTKWPNNNLLPAHSPGGSQIAFSSDRRHPDVCCEDLFVMRADGSRQHMVATGLQGVIDAAWGPAPPAPARSPGTLSQPTAPAPEPGTSHLAGCHKAPAWLTRMGCGAAHLDFDTTLSHAANDGMTQR